MKTGSLFLFFFLISVAAIVLNPGAVDAGRVLKKKNIIVTAQADKIPCDHHNLLNGDHELVEGILKNKLPSGPSGGVGHNYINSVGSEKMKTSNTLKMNKLPSGPSPGVGHNYIKHRNIVVTARADTIPCDHHSLVNGVLYEVGDILKNKLPSGPSGGVGHNYIDSVGSEKVKTSNTLKMNKLPSGPSPGVGHNYINAAGKASAAAERLITTMPLSKLPSGPSGGVGHSHND